VGLLALALLATSPEAAKPSLPDACELASPHIALTTGSVANPPVVCISPDLSLTLRFDSQLQPGSEKLQQRERFQEFNPGERSLMLIPPERLLAGERFKVEVCFADGEAPACATVLLLAHPALGMQQVKVFRQALPVAYFQEVAWEAQTDNQRLREELRQLRAEHGAPDGLRGVFASELLTPAGIACKRLSDVTEAKGNALSLNNVRSCRARGSIAVEVKLENPGTAAWMAAGAVLRGRRGEVLKPLPLWQPEPIPASVPGVESQNWGRVVVEVPATEAQARGTYTLTLWDAEQKRTITLGNITFP
jgi:uncharacterized protein (TIGR02268 family)